MAKKPKIIEQIPLPDKVIYWGGVAGALMVLAGAWTLFGGPRPMMEGHPIVEAVETLEETRSADRIDQLSRWIRDDKRERYDVEQRLEYDPENRTLHDQKIMLEEDIEEKEVERAVLRKKDGK